MNRSGPLFHCVLSRASREILLGVPMAELVVSMAIGPLMSMLKDKASNYLLDQYQVMEGMEEQHKILKRKLPAILDVITDAEEQATAHREGAKAWLRELKMVAYEANEVFDEFKYEALRREAKKNGHYRNLGFRAVKLFPTHNRVVFRRKMSRKLCQVLQDIEVLVTEMHAFRFKYRPQPSVFKKWRQTDYVIVDPHDIARRSRYKYKKQSVDILLGQASNADLAVVPIVGMGGLGKTTLAQLIYNEPEIQKHFPLLLWVCVSDNFDVNSLAKSIVEASPKKNEDIEKPPLDRLQKLVSGQRYMLVLDDVWNNREFHKWERLKVCLQHGGIGSVVLTTTRDKQVAEMMGAGKAYHLNDLDDIFLKEIIETRAFSLEKQKPTELIEMVGEIVKRCRGSPLAATALGSVLRTKTSVNEWKAISSRSSICTEEIGILPILKLSYNDLPSYMKQCFAFCAIFPKDYKIDVEKLIQLWIANAFIPKHNEDSFETTGRHIFNELASRSFFLEIEEDKNSGKYYSRTTCKIHDLMHDIAMSVMEKECVVATEESSQTEWLPDTARHLFLSCKETEGILNISMEKMSPSIQTLLCDRYVGMSLQHLSKYSFLRALKLVIRTESFLLKPKYLHQLRYLDLSCSNIESLPGDIGILYNLQMLDLSNCYFLVQLPRQIKYMTSLRHLYTHGCSKLKSMPPELGKLTELQTLTYFVAAVNSPDCSDVAELQNLNLCGQLELSQVENVTEAEAKVANLGTKKDLRDLRLTWTSVCDSEVLDNFKPHDGLQVLRIYSYGGKCMGMLQNMVEIHLFHCERLHVLFRCGTSFTFPNLKQLTLEHLLDFERWWEINERQEGQIIFPVLQELFIRECGKLIALPEAPLLQELCSGRYRMVHTPFPALKVLKLEDLESFQRWDAEVEGVEMLFPQLEELSIENCPKLVALPGAPLLQETCTGGGYRLERSAFPALKVLKLENLESFQRWDTAAEGVEILFPQLEKLSIERCRKLIALPEAPLLQETCSTFPALKRWDAEVEGVEILFPRLEELSIENCPKLVALPGAPLLQETCTGGGYRLERSAFPALKVLKLENLESFQRWDTAAEGVEILFPQLEKLSIERCRKLIALPEAPLLQETCSTFPALKVLKMEKLESFHKWDAKAGSEQMLFPQLMDLPEAPKLSVLEIKDGKKELFHWVDIYLSSLTELTLRLENAGTTSEAECTSVVMVDSREKWNQKSPLTVMKLGCCNSFFGLGGLEPWGYFVHLGVLTIESCDVLVHWPEVVFQSLVCLNRLAIAVCNNLTGYAETPLEPSAFERSQHLPALESLFLGGCTSLVEIFNVPASLKIMTILGCSKLESIFGKQQLGTSELVQGSSCSEAIMPTAVSPVNHFRPCLKYLRLYKCDSLSGVLHLPPSLEAISIESCNSIQVMSCQLDGLPKPRVTASINAPGPSAATATGEHSLPPSLEDLYIKSCAGMLGGILRLPTSHKKLVIKDNSGLTSLVSLSGEPPSLEQLILYDCSTLASLPNEPQAYGSLQQLEIKDCHAMKKLPRCLQQRLCSIQEKDLDAQYEVMASKPKTWKEIPRLTGP
uniref:Uncharacterized protein n=1 Tax=Avena sativa TaxID=4498 RepID=A0ACD5ZKJ1_AVESA